MSTWTNLRDTVEKVAPGLASLIPGYGPLIGGLLSTALGTSNNPDDVALALQKDPDAAVKLKALEVQQAVLIAQLQAQEAQANATRIQAVQTTITAEAEGKGGWVQANWHAIGSLWALGLISCIYVVIPIWHGYKPEVVVPLVDPSAWLMMGAILGVASWNDKRNT